MKKACTLMAALLLTACAVNYGKQGASIEQRDRDLKECQYEASKAVASSSTDAFGIGQSPMSRALVLTNQCMELRGYSRQ